MIAMNEYDRYIENDIVEMYINDMDNIVESFIEESISFEQFIMEDDNPAANADKSGTIETNGKGPAFREKLKNRLNDLKALLQKFAEAILNIFTRMKGKINGIKKKIMEKFKAEGTVLNDQTVLKFEIIQPKVEALKKIKDEIENDIISPIQNNQEPKASDLADYESRFKEVSYSSIAGSDTNFTQYKKGQRVSIGYLQNAANSMDNKADDINVCAADQKKNIGVIDRIINAITGGKEDANVNLLQKACNLSMRITKDIIKYNTKYIGDFTKLVLNCGAGNVKAGATEVKQKVVNKVKK